MKRERLANIKKKEEEKYAKESRRINDKWEKLKRDKNGLAIQRGM